MSYARISRMAGRAAARRPGDTRHQPTTDVRSEAYELSDGYHGLERAIAGDPTMKADDALAAVMRQVLAANDALFAHLNANYLWD